MGPEIICAESLKLMISAAIKNKFFMINFNAKLRFINHKLYQKVDENFLPHDIVITS
jgi:hypothetical protein